MLYDIWFLVNLGRKHQQENIFLFHLYTYNACACKQVNCLEAVIEKFYTPCLC